MTVRQLQAWAKKRGYRLAAAGVGVLDEIRAALQARRERGEIDANFFKENLEFFTYLENCPIEKPRSVILIAVARPAHILSFRHQDRIIETILPPTYVRYRPTFEDVRDDLRRALSGTGHRLEILEVPLKSLGASLGILSYGRNNIGYIEGMGSAFQLVGLVSDLPIEEKSGFRPLEGALLEKCRKCRACAAACPMGAIGQDRFLLHAEKCYTLFSESMNPIPEDLQPPSPRCLIGCLKCQDVCPENKGRMRYEKAPVAFSAEETGALLEAAEGSDYGLKKVQGKIQALGLSENPYVYARNLKRLINSVRSIR
jgi:epoxyqueuosine reductase